MPNVTSYAGHHFKLNHHKFGVFIAGDVNNGFHIFDMKTNQWTNPIQYSNLKLIPRVLGADADEKTELIYAVAGRHIVSFDLEKKSSAKIHEVRKI